MVADTARDAVGGLHKSCQMSALSMPVIAGGTWPVCQTPGTYGSENIPHWWPLFTTTHTFPFFFLLSSFRALIAFFPIFISFSRSSSHTLHWTCNTLANRCALINILYTHNTTDYHRKCLSSLWLSDIMSHRSSVLSTWQGVSVGPVRDRMHKLGADAERWICRTPQEPAIQKGSSTRWELHAAVRVLLRAQPEQALAELHLG